MEMCSDERRGEIMKRREGGREGEREGSKEGEPPRFFGALLFMWSPLSRGESVVESVHILRSITSIYIHRGGKDEER